MRVVGDHAMRSIVSASASCRQFRAVPADARFPGMAFDEPWLYVHGGNYGSGPVDTRDLVRYPDGVPFRVAKQVGASELVIVAGDNVEMTMTRAAEGVAEEVAVDGCYRHTATPRHWRFQKLGSLRSSGDAAQRVRAISAEGALIFFQVPAGFVLGPFWATNVDTAGSSLPRFDLLAGRIASAASRSSP